MCELQPHTPCPCMHTAYVYQYAAYLTPNHPHTVLHYREKQKLGYWDRDTHDLDTVDAVSQRV